MAILYLNPMQWTTLSGSYLRHVHDENGKKTISRASKLLIQAKRKCCTTRKKLFAIVTFNTDTAL